jgi:hypothetical protein
MSFNCSSNINPQSLYIVLMVCKESKKDSIDSCLELFDSLFGGKNNFDNSAILNFC